MKKLLAIILTICFFTSCNNVDEILSNFNNLVTNQVPKEKEEDIDKIDQNERKLLENEEYQQDFCDILMQGGVEYFNQNVEEIVNDQTKLFEIGVNYEDEIIYIIYAGNKYYKEDESMLTKEVLEKAIEEAITLDYDPIFLISSEGSNEIEDMILSIISIKQDLQDVRYSDRYVCLLNGMRLQAVRNERQKRLPPPPPPPPDVIEIVEDYIEIEDEIVIEDTETEEEMIEIEEDDEEIFMVVETMPEFPGGDLGLIQYIQKNVRYPPIAKEYNITGRVFVRYVIEKDGSVSNVEVARGVDKYLDAEALRVIKSMPRYKPGTQFGKPVRVYFTVPINFRLD